MSLQIRRTAGTIQYGHLNPEKYSDMVDYFQELGKIIQNKKISAGAFALEVGEETGRMHIQFYMEFEDRVRTSQLRNWFDLHLPKHESAFRRVIDARGAWDYCAGIGRYAEKPAIGRHVFGDPRLHGSETNVKLADLVQMVIDGNDLRSIMLHNPYAWTVHRHRIVQLWRDWNGRSTDADLS